MDISSRLNQLAERLRDSDPHMTGHGLLCRQAAQHINNQERYIRELKRRLAEQHTQKRMAVALEQAAMHGWGNVAGESLLDDAPAPPVEGDI